MTKKEFLSALRRKICKLPRKEIRERIGFYSEIIDDKIEEGLSEADAVADVGGIEEIAKQILSDTNLEITEKKYKKAASPWQIVLLVIGSPIWLSILIAVFAVIWSVIITIWAVEIPLFIISIISKFLVIACLESTKFAGKLTKRCIDSIASLFCR